MSACIYCGRSSCFEDCREEEECEECGECIDECTCNNDDDEDGEPDEPYFDGDAADNEADRVHGGRDQ